MNVFKMYKELVSHTVFVGFIGNARAKRYPAFKHFEHLFIF